MIRKKIIIFLYKIFKPKKYKLLYQDIVKKDLKRKSKNQLIREVIELKILLSIKQKKDVNKIVKKMKPKYPPLPKIKKG
jgi:hypothetical protein